MEHVYIQNIPHTAPKYVLEADYRCRLYETMVLQIYRHIKFTKKLVAPFWRYNGGSLMNHHLRFNLIWQFVCMFLKVTRVEGVPLSGRFISELSSKVQ